MSKEINDLYNAEIKERFIQSCYDNPKTYVKVKSDLLKVAPYENRLGKDMYNFTRNELVDMLSGGLNCKTATSFVSCRSILDKYRKWALAEHYTEENIDIKSIFTIADITNAVSRLSLEERYPTKKEIKDLCENKLVNGQDSILFALFFSGAKGEGYSEIINLKWEDCNEDTNEITLTNEEFDSITEKTTISRRTIVEDWVMKTIKDANEQIEYYKDNGVAEHSKSPIVNIPVTNYILRYTRNKKNVIPETKVTYLTINKRIEKLKKMFELDYISPTSLHKAGLFNYLQELEVEKGALTKQDFINARMRYGLSVTQVAVTMDEYKNLFGKGDK